MAYGESNGHVADDVNDTKGETRVPNISKTAGDAS